MKQKRKKDKRKLWKRKKKERKSEENVFGNSDTLGQIPNNALQVAELDESVMKEFSWTYGKQSDIERNGIGPSLKDKVPCFCLRNRQNWSDSSRVLLFPFGQSEILRPSADSSTVSLENSEAQPCNGLNPLPAERKKKKRKIRETSTTQGDSCAEVPYNILQANEPDVKDNITCSFGNSCQILEHEVIGPTGETNCLTMKQKRKKDKRKLWKWMKQEARAMEKISGKSLQANEPDVKDNITCSSGNSRQILEHEEIRPSGETNRLTMKQKKKKDKRKLWKWMKQEARAMGKISGKSLQANEPDVKDNITCSSGNAYQILEHEEIRPSGETNCLTMKQKRKKDKRKLWNWMKKEARAMENVSGKSNTLAETPNNVSQVAELDENILKEFSSTCGKQKDIERKLCSFEKEDVLGEAHTLLSDFSNMSISSSKKRGKKLETDWSDFSEDHVHKETSFRSNYAHISYLSDSKPEQVEERIQVTLAQASMGTSRAEASVHDPEQSLDLPEKPETIKLHSAEDGSAEVVLVESMDVTEATKNKNAEKLFWVQIAEDIGSRVDKEIGAASNCNGEDSVDSGLVTCSEHSNGNGFKVNRQIDGVNPLSELLVSEGDIKLDININQGSMPLQILDILSERTSVEPSRKKLLILDLNGLLVDILQNVRGRCEPDLIVSRQAVFKRPFVDDFLQYCFEKFAVGVWSSKTRINLDPIVHFLMGDSKGKLLFCWDRSHCTITELTTVENRNKPLVLKELRKLWDEHKPNLPWEKGAYNESNTLLLDDSPYKALRNPANTGIFPHSYHYRDANDNSLGPGGDLRVYLESLALADDVRKYVGQNPFGQKAIDELNPFWYYYKRVLVADPPEDATSKSK
ncbi:uncharacterized protein LOC115726611 [Rhodamnia argentea]|uniref:Uncharacterized protein LOC115726611 n=1 Tax=Rhodamnia argentea TaxID=178133 RepID=A0ABM3HGB0_9MYRT|nr:uncharacterized protein LOC115726611 [Rhodamnia argentea]